MSKCKNCQYWDNDTGFCEVKTIPTLSTENCEHFKKSVSPSYPYTPTPTLHGSATKAFLDDMMRPDNDKEKEIKERIKKGNHIKFL